MSAGSVVLWRHGQTDYNAAGRLQGQIDIPLNDTGKIQAREAGLALARLEPAAIITSDLSRAVDTARTLGDLARIDVQIDNRLRERSFGEWEGLTQAEIKAGWSDAFTQWRTGLHPEGVSAETRQELGERFAAAINDWASEFEMSDTVVFVTHGAAISTGITALLAQDPEEWRGISGIANCHWSLLHPYTGQPPWRLSQHNTGVS